MEHVGRLLKRIHMIMDRNFNNMLNQYDLTAAQLDVLIPLFRSHGMLKNPTVTGTLKRLEAKGFIVRTPLETDRRYNQITLTERARELDAALLNSIHTNDARMLAGFDETERTQLFDYLSRIIDNLADKGGCT